MRFSLAATTALLLLAGTLSAQTGREATPRDLERLQDDLENLDDLLGVPRAE